VRDGERGHHSADAGKDCAGQQHAAEGINKRFINYLPNLVSSGTRLTCDQKPYVVELDSGSRIPARAIVIATGAQYRRLCKDEEVVVVGGGNSAGQAATFLAEGAKHLYVLVRSDGLSGTMSRYLIRRIEDTPNITVLSHTEIVALDGGDHVEHVTWRCNKSGKTERKKIAHVFVMTGAVPNSDWLGGCVVLDSKGFIETGHDLSTEELISVKWPLARQPYLLETTLPGVFAAGDVRSGNIKRVASAVGEGSIAISFVHQLLNH
jgi:thioredoxin reductase (NADPH)